MKKIITGILILVLAAGAAQAQTKEEKHKGRHDMMMQKLNVTAEQKTRLQAIDAEQHKDLAELKKNDQMRVVDFKAKKKELHERYREQRLAVLTKEQRAQWEQLKKEKGGKATTHRKREPNFPQELNLSDDQKAKMASLRREFKDKAEAIKGNTALTPEQKREQFRDLSKQHRERVKSLLTKEQLERMESLRKGRSAK